MAFRTSLTNKSEFRSFQHANNSSQEGIWCWEKRMGFSCPPWGYHGSWAFAHPSTLFYFMQGKYKYSYTSSSQSTKIKYVFLAILCDLFGGGENVTPIQKWIVTSNDHLVDVYSIRTLRGAIFTHEAHFMQGQRYWGWLHIDLIWYSKTILPKLTSIICMTPNARNPRNFSSSGSFFAQSLSVIEPKQIR